MLAVLYNAKAPLAKFPDQSRRKLVPSARTNLVKYIVPTDVLYGLAVICR